MSSVAISEQRLFVEWYLELGDRSRLAWVHFLMLARQDKWRVPKLPFVELARKLLIGAQNAVQAAQDVQDMIVAATTNGKLSDCGDFWKVEHPQHWKPDPTSADRQRRWKAAHSTKPAPPSFMVSLSPSIGPTFANAGDIPNSEVSAEISSAVAEQPKTQIIEEMLIAEVKPNATVEAIIRKRCQQVRDQFKDDAGEILERILGEIKRGAWKYSPTAALIGKLAEALRAPAKGHSQRAGMAENATESVRA